MVSKLCISRLSPSFFRAHEHPIEALSGISLSAFVRQSATFDTCISRIQPKFDDLALSEKQEVVLNFLVYQNLDGGFGVIFSELIHPCQAEISNYLSSLSDNQLKSILAMNIWDWWRIKQYRSNLDRLQSSPRGSNGTGLSDIGCNVE
ncbi:MAG: hypothetical protein AAGA18_16240 [Verrucomicrobiota bacterium]